MNELNYRNKIRIVRLLTLLIFLYGCKVTDGKDGNGNGGRPESQNTGWLYTRGNSIFISDGQIWQGRGANLQDTRGCNACTWDQPNTAEVKRRIDHLTGVWGADFIRLTLESYEYSQGRTHWQGIRFNGVGK